MVFHITGFHYLLQRELLPWRSFIYYFKSKPDDLLTHWYRALLEIFESLVPASLFLVARQGCLRNKAGHEKWHSSEGSSYSGGGVVTSSSVFMFSERAEINLLLEELTGANSGVAGHLIPPPRRQKKPSWTIVLSTELPDRCEDEMILWSNSGCKM